MRSRELFLLFKLTAMVTELVGDLRMYGDAYVNLLRSVFVLFGSQGWKTDVGEGPIPVRHDRGGLFLDEVLALFPGEVHDRLHEVLTNLDYNNYTSLNGMRPRVNLNPAIKGFDFEPGNLFTSSASMWSLMRSFQSSLDPVSVQVIGHNDALDTQLFNLTHCSMVNRVSSAPQVVVVDVQSADLDFLVIPEGAKVVLYANSSEVLQAKKLVVDRLVSEQQATVFLEFTSLKDVMPSGVCMIADPELRGAYKNVNEHCRASLATSTAAMVQACAQENLAMPECISTLRAVETRVNQHWIKCAKDRFGVALDDQQVLMQHGASGAMTTALETLRLHYDVTKVVFPVPYFSPDRGMARVAHLSVVEGALDAEKSWSKAMIEMLEAQCVEESLKGQVVVLTMPNNPDGHVPTYDEAREVLQFILERGGKVIGDFTYYNLFHDPELQQDFDRIVGLFFDNNCMSLFSHTKSLSLGGDRVCSVHCRDKPLLEQNRQLRDVMFDSVSMVSMLAFADAFTSEATRHRVREQEAFSKQIQRHLDTLRSLVDKAGLGDVVDLPRHIHAGLYGYFFVKGVTGSAVFEEAKLSQQLVLDDSRFGGSSRKDGAYFRISMSGLDEKKQAGFNTWVAAIKAVREATQHQTAQTVD